MKKILLALALALGGLATAPASPAAASQAHTYTACSQAYGKFGIGTTFGCIDLMTSFGPVFQGWNSASGQFNPAWSFGINNPSGGALQFCSGAQFTDAEWTYGGGTATHFGNWPSGNPCSGSGSTTDSSNPSWPWMTSSQHDILEWLSNSAYYEFVFINA